MPVTVFPARHQSEPLRLNDLIRNATPEEILRCCFKANTKPPQSDLAEKLDHIYTSSFEEEEHVDVYPSANGFVHGAIRAYNAHHHLVIRPDDVWIAILTQLSIYVNKNAEALRSVFVSHQGQKELDLQNAVLGGLDKFADRIEWILSRAVVDPTLPSWIMQRFSTTTTTDRIASGIIMMATFQSYFKYYDCTDCGLPSVTLLGERHDWKQLLESVDRLKEFVPKEQSVSSSQEDDPSAQMERWVNTLKVVLSRFVKSFDAPDATETIEFWQKIADYRIRGSGADHLSGWLTAFCFWTVNGKCTALSGRQGMLSIDGVTFPTVDWSDVPPGWGSVPLQTQDDLNPIVNCRMLAGSVGITPFLAHISPSAGSAEERESMRCRGLEIDEESGTTRKIQAERTNARSDESHGFLHKLLTCCESTDNAEYMASSESSVPMRRLAADASNVQAQAQPDMPKLAIRRPAEQTLSEGVKSEPGELKQTPAEAAKQATAEATVDIVSLPPYPEAPIGKPYDARSLHDYEYTGEVQKVAMDPPKYKLDGLRPRIGWFLWEEKSTDEKPVNESSRLPDGLEYYRHGLKAMQDGADAAMSNHP